VKQSIRRGRLAALLAAGAFVVLAGASQVDAQQARSQTRGLILGVNLSSASLEVEDGDREQGGGGGFIVGWGFSDRFAVFLRGDAASIDVSNPQIDGEYTLAIVDLGVRYSFRGPEHRFIPYVVGAFSGMTASAEIFLTPVLSSDVELRGGGLTLGGGFNWFFNPSLALDVQLLFTGGQFTEVKVGRLSSEIDGLDASAGRLNLALTWFRGR